MENLNIPCRLSKRLTDNISELKISMYKGSQEEIMWSEEEVMDFRLQISDRRFQIFEC